MLIIIATTTIHWHAFTNRRCMKAIVYDIEINRATQDIAKRL